MSRSKGTKETQGINGDAAVLQRWLEAAGGSAGGLAPCPYARHRSTDWKGSAEALWTCGICHPPAVPALVFQRREGETLNV